MGIYIMVYIPPISSKCAAYFLRRKVQVLDASTGKENKKEGHSTAKCNITYIRI
jgi:hypothetical protein